MKGNPTVWVSNVLPVTDITDDGGVRRLNRGQGYLYWRGRTDGRKEENEARAELMRDGGYLSAIVPLTCLPKGQA